MLHHGVLIVCFYQGLELEKHERKLALETLAPAKKFSVFKPKKHEVNKNCEFGGSLLLRY